MTADLDAFLQAPRLRVEQELLVVSTHSRRAFLVILQRLSECGEGQTGQHLR